MKNFIFIFFTFFISPGSAQSLPQKIEKAYNQFENDQQMIYGISSLSVLNAQTGEVVYSKNGNTGLAPASTLKTITAAAAYYLLGKEFTWQTTLGYTGSISANGTLNGNIIITGGGDPTLGSSRYGQTKDKIVLNNWSLALSRAGIKHVTGYIIADDRLFGTQTTPDGWPWQDIGNYYGAGPSSLTWRENQFNLVFKPGNVGEPALLIRSEPEMDYLKIVNEVRTGRPGTGDSVYAYSAPYSRMVYLRGTYGIDLKKTIAVSVPDPAFDVAYHLQNRLKQTGIQTALGPITTRELTMNGKYFLNPSAIIDIQTSPSLEKVVHWFNQKSINLYGEHLIKTIAWKQNKDITTSKGVESIKDFWNKKLGIDPGAINIYDGSGLSPTNRVTSLAMVKILQSLKKEPWFDSFYESLPVNNKMKMKSGTITDVIAYTGYHTSSSGTPLVFSFIVNNYSGRSSALRQKMFNVLDALK